MMIEFPGEEEAALKDSLFNKEVFLTALGLFLASLFSAQAVYRLGHNLAAASWLLFPLRIYQRLNPLLHKPGYDDIQLGACLFPGCKTAAIVMTLLISILIYMLAGALVVNLLKQVRGKE